MDFFLGNHSGPPGTQVNSVWPYPLLYGTPSPPHIPPYIGVFWVLVEGGQCRERNFFGKKVEKSETTPICEKKIFGKFSGKLEIFYVSYKMENEIIGKYLNKEFGSYKITKYLGYYANGNQKYKRHFFEKECKFCGNTSYNPPGQLNNLMKKEDICCNLCNGSVNIHTKEKKCASCQVWFPATSKHFALSKNRPFGVHYYCLDCHNKKNRKHRENPENRQKEYKQKRERMKNDPLFKLKCNIRVQIKNYVKRVNLNKPKPCSTTEILGCSFHEFKEHIQKQFTEGMSWDNYGTWHYEHIIPVSFGKTTQEVIELCHYTNYRPFWGSENQSKGNKIIWEDISEENKVRYKKYLYL